MACRSRHEKPPCDKRRLFSARVSLGLLKAAGSKRRLRRKYQEPVEQAAKSRRRQTAGSAAFQPAFNEKPPPSAPFRDGGGGVRVPAAGVADATR